MFKKQELKKEAKLILGKLHKYLIYKGIEMFRMIKTFQFHLYHYLKNILTIIKICIKHYIVFEIICNNNNTNLFRYIIKTLIEKIEECLQQIVNFLVEISTIMVSTMNKVKIN